MSMLSDDISTPLQKIDHPLFEEKRVTLYIKREDLIHSEISGNKWYKLKHNLLHAKSQGIRRLVSFGGAFSNHLHALAYAGRVFGFETVGYVRGERRESLNPTLADADAWGMQLHFLSRCDYRNRHDKAFVAALIEPHQPCLMIPEGGANQLALQGCAEIVTGIQRQLGQFDYLCVPCGTGATLAGIVNALDQQTRVLGFPALKGADSLREEISAMLHKSGHANGADWCLVDRFHCGGFAKLTAELVSFMRHWHRQTGVALEPVYTGKMMMGICQLLVEGYFPEGSQIVAVHTGGMQGLRGMQDKMARLHAG